MSGSGVSLVIPIALGSHPAGRSRFAHFADAAPLTHCLRAMLEPSRRFDAVVVAVAEAHHADARSILSIRGFDAVALVTAPDPGSRADCLRAGLDALTESDAAVVVHDLSRPLVSYTVRNRVIDALDAGHDLVVPALVMVDSVKAVDRHGTVVTTVDRTLLRSSQFPRGLRTRALRDALDAAPDDVGFDEVAVALADGTPITTVDGDPDGFEISDRDLILAEAIVSCRLEGRR